jgi:hypothetical protein
MIAVDRRLPTLNTATELGGFISCAGAREPATRKSAKGGVKRRQSRINADHLPQRHAEKTETYGT